VIYRYVAPPKPELPEGDNVIVVPEEEGTPVTVWTHANGMTTYLHRERHDYHAAERMIAAIQDWLDSDRDEFIGLPNSQFPDFPVWASRDSLTKGTLHFHDATVHSPIAVERQSGKHIIVPMGDGQIRLPKHGPGKRQ
jgi:hypothetical protein